ncbi:MAG TPA: 2-phosphosulfolactate phosphatase, partial [Verrucomicrobiae bacterium]|nr:2-phosphosulfolactate phosphatase [Verrucomicrobiae bacterium]
MFTPAEFAALGARDLSRTTCVVFDILRATSTIITALANGAAAVIPVAEIPEALAIRKQRPEALLAGERHGLRIGANLTGGTDFDFGNSPREFIPAVVRGKTIVLSTTNGSRALRACAGANTVLIGSFLNLRATADSLEQRAVENLLLVCSGTADQAAFEDILGAGALADLLWPRFVGGKIADSAVIARAIYQLHQHDLLRAMDNSRNGRCLRSIPDLRADVDWC